MASVEDVQDKLVQLIADTVYPSGVDNPAATPMDVMVYAGWPVPDQLDKDIALGKAHVSVFTRPEERNTSRGISESSTHTVDMEAGTGTTLKALRQQQQLFQITVWADSPSHRAILANLIDVALAGIYRIQMPDGSMAQLTYRNSITQDDLQKAAIYRKELFYFVEYATTKVTTDYVIKDANLTVTRVATIP